MIFVPSSPAIVALVPPLTSDIRPYQPRLQSLAQPVGKLGLAKLSQVVNALFAEIDAADLEVLSRSAANALDNNRGVGLENNTIINDFVNGERNKIVVLYNCALINGLPAG